MARSRLHFFVCTNRRDRGEPTAGCGSSCGATVAELLRKGRMELGLISSVYITETGCLGPCPRQGAAVLVYPEGVWYSAVEAADVAELVTEHMARGCAVERLRDRSFEV